MTYASAEPKERRGRIDPTSPDAPTRVIVRIACGFLLAVQADGIRRFGSLQRAMIFTAIIVANVHAGTRAAVRSWRYAGWPETLPDCECRPVSIRGLSHSARIPFETTRAHVNALIDEGLCLKTEDGVVAPPDILSSERMLAAEAVLLNAFWSMIDNLKLINFDFSVVMGNHTSPAVVENNFNSDANEQSRRSLMIRVISEFYVNAVIDAIAPHGDDFNTGAIYASYMILNSRTLSLDAEIVWQYATADDAVPDDLRAYVSITEVANLLSLGHELVRRKTHDLVAAGRLERKGRGYLVSTEHMQGANARAGGAAIVKSFYRMIYDLTALGVRL